MGPRQLCAPWLSQEQHRAASIPVDQKSGCRRKSLGGMGGMATNTLYPMISGRKGNSVTKMLSIYWDFVKAFTPRISTMSWRVLRPSKDTIYLGTKNIVFVGRPLYGQSSSAMSQLSVVSFLKRQATTEPYGFAGFELTFLSVKMVCIR